MSRFLMPHWDMLRTKIARMVKWSVLDTHNFYMWIEIFKIWITLSLFVWKILIKINSIIFCDKFNVPYIIVFPLIPSLEWGITIKYLIGSYILHNIYLNSFILEWFSVRFAKEQKMYLYLKVWNLLFRFSYLQSNSAWPLPMRSLLQIVRDRLFSMQSKQNKVTDLRFQKKSPRKVNG